MFCNIADVTVVFDRLKGCLGPLALISLQALCCTVWWHDLKTLIDFLSSQNTLLHEK